MNIAHGFVNAVEKHPEKIAVIFQDRKLTFSDLNGRANRLADYFLKSGLRPGNRVGVLLHNSAETLEIYLGFAKAGIPFVPINFRFAPPEIDYVLHNAGISDLILGSEFLPVIEELEGRLPVSRENCYVLGPGGNHPFRAYEQILQEGRDREPALTAREEDVLYICYTSGTTGFPKGVVLPHKTYLERFFMSIIEFGIHGQDVGLLVMPLFHGNSGLFSLLSMFIGATIHIYPSGSFNGQEILQIVEKSRITFTSLIPTMYNIILNQPDAVKKAYNLKSLRLLICSSAPLLTQTKEAILNFFAGAELYEFYSSIETGFATCLKPRDQWRKIRCVGRPLLGKEVKILDPQGQEVPVGEVGELYCRGIGIFREYFQNPEETRQRRRGEWVTVGDMGKFDSEGYVYLVDRKNDMIISGGENVFPTEVEEVLSRHPAVAELAVVGVPDSKWGEAVKAVVVVKPGEDVSPAELIQFCRGKIAGYKIPKTVDLVPELPKNPTGKILRRRVRENYWRDQEIKI